ncbi:thiaminase II [Commensalibacter oyaizuii]|uniref:Aminopyrimidine aminohydrolase n=1 Tax=Commensalibacter oyaizuii TaxID=3043873 RepID=A0ABT6Q0F1_9PROT|nr:thiaminase II [Commensalibacter sp. TBRC 16381]MDI2090578.1 thiaminase II [Commensalibacter sp. TBRC 16381]
MSAVIKNTLSLLDQGLIGRFRADCGQDWQQFTQHRFVKELALGTLNQEEFKKFLVQDYLYLLDYCRVEALAVYKSDQFQDMQYFSSLLHGLVNIELPLHIKYCQEWGMSEKEVNSSPKTLELLAYTQYLLSKAMQGDLLDLIVLLMPCLVGYGEIGLKMLIDPNTNQMNNPYQSWIDLYAGNEYLELIHTSLTVLERLARQRGGEERYSMLLEQFRTAVKLETAFWNVGRSQYL